MNFLKTLVFLSPIPWDFHNRQIPLFAGILTKRFRVVYVDSANPIKQTLSIKSLIYKKNREKYFNYLKEIRKKENVNPVLPLFITVRNYKEGGKLSNADKLLYFTQLRLLLKIMSSAKKFYIYCCTAQFDTFWKKMKARWIFDFFDRFPDDSISTINNEKWLIRNSSLLIVHSNLYKSICKKLLSARGFKKVYKLPIGYDLNDYLKVMPAKSKNRIVVGYEGGISDRLDFDLIEKVIRNNNNIDFRFIGPFYFKSVHNASKKITTNTFVSRLKKMPNVSFVDFMKKTGELADYMAEFSVGWIPYNKDVIFNRYSSPNKFYEYCAVGLPVISTSLPVLKEYKELVYFADDLQSFRRALADALRNNTAKKVELRKSFAEKNNIQNKFFEVIGILGSKNV